MKSRRRKGREIALRLLYQLDITKGDAESALKEYCSAFPVGDETRSFAEKLVRGVGEHMECIDSILKETSRNWSVERMAMVDRNILRMALFEMKFMGDIPPKVSMNEAIELAKAYGSDESPAFVNGILDKIYQGEKSAPSTGEAL